MRQQNADFEALLAFKMTSQVLLLSSLRLFQLVRYSPQTLGLFNKFFWENLVSVYFLDMVNI